MAEPRKDFEGESRVKQTLRQGTQAAESEWARSKKNVKKLLTVTRDDFDAQKLVGRLLHPSGPEDDQDRRKGRHPLQARH